VAKIFLAFFNGLRGMDSKNAMPIFYEAFIKGLLDNGNEVFAFMHSTWIANFNPIPRHLLNEIKEFNPDLIILFNNSFYDVSSYFDCPIIIYEVDSPLYYANKKALKANPSRYKFFVAASNHIDILTNEFNVPKDNILLVPFFTEIHAEDIEKKHNICFIGTKFTDNYLSCLQKFMALKPTDEEREEFKNLVKIVEDRVFITKEELLKDTTSEKIINTINPGEIVGFLSAHRRLKTLSNLTDLGLDIWGTPNWITDIYNEPWLILNFHSTPVYSIKHNQDIYNSSKIGINIGHLQAKTGFPWRVFDILASNACLVTEYHSDFKKYIPDLKLPFFTNHWEAREQCKKILENENYRLDIVQHSQEVVNKKYRFINTLKIIEDFLVLNLGSNEENGKGNLLLTRDDLWKEPPKKPRPKPKPKLKLKNKIRYKIWHHYNKILKRKGII